MLFDQCFSLIPSSPPSRMVAPLGEKCSEDFVFSFILFEATEDVLAFVDNPSQDPSCGKAS